MNKIIRKENQYNYKIVRKKYNKDISKEKVGNVFKKVKNGVTW